MEYKKSKRKIFKRIGAIVGAFVLTIVAFSLPFFGKFDSKLNSKHLVASADEVVSGETLFSGSTYCMSVSGGYRIYNSGTQSYVSVYCNGVANVKYDFYFIDASTIQVKVTLTDLSLAVDYMPYNLRTFSGPYVAYYNCVLGQTGSNYIQFDLDSHIAFFLTFDYSLPSSFNLKLYSFSISTTSNQSGIKFVNFRYNDSAGGVFVFSMKHDPMNWNWSSIYSTIFINYSTRTYYFSDALSDNEYYQSGYDEGNAYGYSLGYSAGESAGYSSGYSAGETIGYNNGYSQGVEASGSYSFFSLISAVIDAPIQAFMGLFNFELLGINLAGFFTGLLTLAFIITIVRLVMP